MQRPSRDQVLMEHAAVAAIRSTCSRAQVGVVIAMNARILVTGYNGAPKHLPHCDHTCDCGFDTIVGDMGEVKIFHSAQCRSELPCEVSVHAEANAIAYAARYGIALKGSVMYSTHLPCRKCAELIVNAGIERVVYDIDYRLKSGQALLEDAGVVVDKVG